MDRIEQLYEDNKEKIVIRENDVKPVDVLRQMMDVKERPLSVFPTIRIKMLEENARLAFQEQKSHSRHKEPALRVYEVVKNEKSAAYYRTFYEEEIFQHPVPMFENQVVYFILEEELGLMETNITQLYKDFGIAYGITNEDLVERNAAFAEYITLFDPERWNPPAGEESGMESVVDVLELDED